MIQVTHLLHDQTKVPHALYDYVQGVTRSAKLTQVPHLLQYMTMLQMPHLLDDHDGRPHFLDDHDLGATLS